MQNSELTLPATYQEIVSQPAAWQQALELIHHQAKNLQALWHEENYTQVIFTGCGSTYYLSLAAAALFQELTGSLARAVPAGELALYPASAYPKQSRTLLVAVSRSAETTETVQAVKAFQQHGQGQVITLSNYPERPLTSLGGINLVIPAGQEESFAQTRSFASMYLATTALAALLANREDLLGTMQALPALGQQLITNYEQLAQGWGANLQIDRFYFLGGGPRYGLACEVNLKMKEMTLSHSEPFHFLEFRHGPIAMAGSTTLVIGLLSTLNHPHEAAVLQAARALGASTLALGEAGPDVIFASNLPEPARNVLYLPVLQLLAYYRAVAKGLNPDRPKNLEAVVKLNWEE